MRQNFYINNKIKNIMQNIIYDIKNYNGIIFKYVNLNKCYENRDTILRQSFLINRTLESLNDFNEINSNSLKLNMNLESINNLINETLNEILDLYKSKKVKLTLNKNIDDDFIFFMDRLKIKNCLLNIFSFIFSVVKINGNVDLHYSLMDYRDESLSIFNNEKSYNKLKLGVEYIDIYITFNCDLIPNEIKKKLFKSPLIFYKGSNFNNLYLYTSYKIIKKHSGDMWIKSLEDKESINLIFPVNNKL